MIQGSGLIWARSIREFSLSLHGARCDDGPLTRYVKLWVAHAPGMPGTFSPTPRVSDPDMHHGTCVTHVPWCKPGSLTSGFLWSRRREKRSRHSRCIRNPRFYVSGNRHMRESENLRMFQILADADSAAAWAVLNASLFSRLWSPNAVRNHTRDWTGKGILCILLQHCTSTHRPHIFAVGLSTWPSSL